MGENTDTDLFHGSYPFPPEAAPPAMFSMMHYARFPHRVQAPAEVLPAESDPCVNGFCDFYEFSFSRCGKPWASYRSYGFSSRFLLTAARSCAKLFASKQKGRVDRCDWFFPYVPQCFRAGCLRCIFLPWYDQHDADPGRWPAAGVFSYFTRHSTGTSLRSWVSPDHGSARSFISGPANGLSFVWKAAPSVRRGRFLICSHFGI